MGMRASSGLRASLEWGSAPAAADGRPCRAHLRGKAHRGFPAPRHEKEGPDVLTDIEIAQATEPKPIGEIAAIAGVR